MRCVDDLFYDEIRQVLIYALYDKNGRTVREICDTLYIDSKAVNRWLHNHRNEDIEKSTAYVLLCEIEDTEPERYKRAITRFEALRGKRL